MDTVNCGCTNGICSPGGGTNPNLVLTPSISALIPSHQQWLSSYLAAAGKPYPYADIAAFHGYDATNPEDIIGEVKKFKELITTYGLGNLEIWNTEASWGTIGSASVSQQQASWLMRYHMALAAAGVSRFIWYAYNSSGWGSLYAPPFSTTNTPNQLTPAGVAYPVIQSWMSGASLSSCKQYENGLWICELQRSAEHTSWVLWNAGTSSISVPIPTNLGLKDYRDWQNQTSAIPSSLTIDEMPVLLEN